MARTIINVPADTWTVIPDSDYGVDFQLLGDRECYWKESLEAPLSIPFVEPVFKALPGVTNSTSSKRPELVWLYAPGHAVNVATGPLKCVDVLKQDDTARGVLLNFNQVLNSTTLAAAATIDTYTVTLTDITGFVDGRYIILFDPLSGNYSFYTQKGAPVGNVITLDTPLDFNYPAGANADAAVINMAVDGSVTPQIFGLRGAGVIPGVDVSVDIIRIIFSCLADSTVTLALFANIPALLNGLVLRRRDGYYENIFNLKQNIDLAGIAYDLTVYEATNPAQDLDGFISRLTFNGDDKFGVVKRLAAGEDLEFLVQDDLTGIVSLKVVAEGQQVR